MKKFLKGMHKDANRVDLPEGTYRDALNANLYMTKGAVVNEQGNTLIGTYNSPNFPIRNIIGQCALEDGRIVLFAIDTNPDPLRPATHVISIVDPKQNTYKVLYRDDTLNFQPNYTIEATSKVDNAGHIKVYFTDNYIKREVDDNTGIEYVEEFNPPRVFDVTRQEEYIDSFGVYIGQGQYTPALEVVHQLSLYGSSRFTVDKLDLFMHAGSIPEFNEVEISEGGGVVSGTYHLALAYMDEDRNLTNYLVTSNAVHVVTSPENSFPTEAITGDPQGSQSSKAITWKFTIPVISRNYTFIQPVIIQRFGGGQNQASSEFAYQLDPIPMNDAFLEGEADQHSVTYTGLETVARSSISEVVIDKVRYETAKSIIQLDNRLYISNLQSRGDIGYQVFANNIKLEAVTEVVKRFDPRYFDVLNINKGYTDLYSRVGDKFFRLSNLISTTYQAEQSNDHGDLTTADKEQFSGQNRKGYKDVKLSYKKKSYRRSEVYAFYISFVLKDGTETFAYHIPGRTALSVRKNVPGSGQPNFTTIFEDSSLSDYTPDDVGYLTGFRPHEVMEQYGDAKLYQVTDTQVMINESAPDDNPDPVSTNFWENENEFYPNTDDFRVFTTTQSGQSQEVPDSDLRGLNVRHHKMPSNKDSNYSFITGSNTVFDGNPFNHQANFDPTLFEDADERETLRMHEDIRLLGIKLTDLHIPQFILKQVQGYKIYYAKRRQKDKTIIGQSVPVPACLRGNTVPTMYTKNGKSGPYERAWWMSGVIPFYTKDYLNITSKLFEGASSNPIYLGFPVFAFHDFNLLKNKHTLSGASHIDVQSILGFRYYGGGPGVVGHKQHPNGKFINTQWGPNPEIGNNIDPVATNNDDPDDDFAGYLEIHEWDTSVLLACSYQTPSAIQDNMAVVTPTNNNIYSDTVNNIQSVFTLQPKAATYLPEHGHLETSEAGGFHGAKFLYNFAGESSIALSCSSGLPVLMGFLPNVIYDGLRGQVQAVNPFDDTAFSPFIFAAGYAADRLQWRPRNSYLTSAIHSNITVSNSSNHFLSISQPTIQEGPEDGLQHGGHPAAYLVNLCVLKNNVYDSFDEQNLVWTGYYKSLRNVDLETGIDDRDGEKYYHGAETDSIFGGDTYITRYGFRSTGLSYGHMYYWPQYSAEGTSGNYTDIPFNFGQGTTAGIEIWNTDIDVVDIDITDNPSEFLLIDEGNDEDHIINEGSPVHADNFKIWQRGNNNPRASIFYFFCESDDLIGYRHSSDQEAGVLEQDGRFFDGSSAASVLFNSPIHNNTHMDNMLYMNNYSLNQDLRVTLPLPKKLEDITLFPTRTIRSNVDQGGILDGYRQYLAMEMKDIPKNRGDIWDVFTLGSVLYIHAERSLFVTKGKENLQMGGDTQAFIGSGDIFAQEPDELLPTTEGYGGTDAQFASITTRYGHFFINRKDRKVMLFSGQVEEISALGMEKWFLDNLPFQLEEEYGFDLNEYAPHLHNTFGSVIGDIGSLDAPTGVFGFTAAYDPRFKRIILSKRELVPTDFFVESFNNGEIEFVNGQAIGVQTLANNDIVRFQILLNEEEQGSPGQKGVYFKSSGWTVSYYPELKVWGSRHSYLPRLYSYTTENYYSLINSTDTLIGQVWEHSNEDQPGTFFNNTYNFEFEFIDNTAPGSTKIFSSIYYWTDIRSNSNVNLTETTKHTSPGFTSFYVYNTQQISGAGETINYLSNARLVDKIWYINSFRDLSLKDTLTNTSLVTGVANVQENFTTSVVAPTETYTMFTEEGVVNANYLNTNLQWYDRKRFSDHFLGVRLICNNSSRNLVHLYAAGTKHRKSFR